ncbi:hypothetical protein F01_530122 [Burkholderia cenocepacia]|nr:hypothetical protein F01_530122 [Burkholderia cenocepacia]
MPAARVEATGILPVQRAGHSQELSGTGAAGAPAPFPTSQTRRMVRPCSGPPKFPAGPSHLPFPENPMRYPLQHADQAAVARRPSEPDPRVPVPGRPSRRCEP